MTPVFPFLPTTTVVPTEWSLYIPYFNRVYEGFAQTINLKDNIYFPMAISSTPTNIVNLPQFGAFIICVSGISPDLPTITASLCKSTRGSSGAVSGIGSQVGVGDWAGNSLAITSTATNFQIAHDRTGVTGNFNIRIIGTQ